MMRAGALLAVLLLCGCGWVEVGDPGKADRKPRAADPPKAVSEDGRIRVRKGDSVYLIARRHGVAMRDIIERNGLTAPYRLREGQMLVLPAPRKHLVQAGDSVWLLSRRYNVPFAALVRANGLKKPYTIYKGTTLRIPRGPEPLPKDVVKPRARAGVRSGPESDRSENRRRDAAAPQPVADRRGGCGPVRPVHRCRVGRRHTRSATRSGVRRDRRLDIGPGAASAGCGKTRAEDRGRAAPVAGPDGPEAAAAPRGPVPAPRDRARRHRFRAAAGRPAQ